MGDHFGNFFFTPTSASAVILDFEALVETLPEPTSHYTEDFFRVTHNAVSFEPAVTSGANGNPAPGMIASFPFAAPNAFRIVRPGGTFDLLGLDARDEFSTGSADIVGVMMGGGEIRQSLSPSSETFLEVNVTGFENLTELRIEGDWIIDNIELDPVPEPGLNASLACGAIGGLALGRLRRRAPTRVSG
jgi:hypothetical protein